MRGEFIRGDGLVLPNNVTGTGAARLLDMAFRTDGYPDFSFAIGLCNAVYRSDMVFNDLDIPSAAGGYEPAILPRRQADWGLSLTQEPFVESRPFTFPATGVYDRDVTRLYLGEPLIYHVFALSSPFPAPIRISDLTPAAERTFRYRLYLR